MKQIIVTCSEFDKIGFIPTVIIGFYQSSMKVSFFEDYQKLKERFPHVDIIGCSSESNIYDFIPHVFFEEKDLCVFLCLDIGKEAYQIELHTPESIMEKQEANGVSYGALMFSSRYFLSMEEIIVSLQKEKNIKPVLGAIASVVSSSKMKDGMIFWNGKYYADHILLWLIDTKCYILEGKSIHHFQPVGFDMEVTKAKDNILYEIENRPALDVLEEIVGDITEETITSFDHPFFLKEKENGKLSFTSSPLCSIRAIDKKRGTVSLYRSVHEYAKLKIGVARGREEQEKQLEAFSVFRKRKNAVAFIFNCVGIKANLGLMEFVYLMDLKKKLQLPFIGFHSFGEIGSVDEGKYSVLHNQTISVAILSEREGTVCN